MNSEANEQLWWYNIVISTKIRVVTPTNFDVPNNQKRAMFVAPHPVFTTDNAHHQFKMSLGTCKIWMKRHLPTLQVLEEFGSAMSCCSSALIQSFCKQSGDLLHRCPKPTRHFASANHCKSIPCTTSTFFSRSQGL